MQFPQEINIHIAGFISDVVRATDPQCYRSARCMQVAWREHRARTRACSPCHMCLHIGQWFWREHYGTDVCPHCAGIWTGPDEWNPQNESESESDSDDGWPDVAYFSCSYDAPRTDSACWD